MALYTIVFEYNVTLYIILPPVVAPLHSGSKDRGRGKRRHGPNFARIGFGVWLGGLRNGVREGSHHAWTLGGEEGGVVESLPISIHSSAQPHTDPMADRGLGEL